MQVQEHKLSDRVTEFVHYSSEGEYVGTITKLLRNDSYEFYQDNETIGYGGYKTYLEAEQALFNAWAKQARLAKLIMEDFRKYKESQ